VIKTKLNKGVIDLYLKGIKNVDEKRLKEANKLMDEKVIE
jgi:hypothetical protein